MNHIKVLLLVSMAAVGCGQNKPKVVQPPAPEASTPAPAPTPPPQPIEKDTKVSPGIAVSGDLATLCNLKAANATSPKFDYDKDELAPEDRAVLDQLAACLTSGAAKGKSVALIGRADPRGTEEYNLGLGSRRANTVSQYLSRLGVGEPQLAVTTRGALDATGTDEAGWQQDRRVDVQLKTN